MKRFFIDLIVTVIFILLAVVLMAVTGSQILGMVFAFIKGLPILGVIFFVVADVPTWILI